MKTILLSLAALSLTLSAATFSVSTTAELRSALNNAASNTEDDTILLADGIYKTTEDGNGTFIYNSNNEGNLTLKGSSSVNVILSGDHLDQILKVNRPLKLEKLTFIDANTSDYGGAVYSDSSIDVLDCNFTNNSAHSGGGLYSEADVNSTVTNSVFTNNSADNQATGGGFYLHSVAVSNSRFVNNSAGAGAGFGADEATVIDSIFNDNNASYTEGGAIWTNIITSVINSTFTNNSSISGGAGFHANSSVIVTNSIFTNNSNSNGHGAGFSSSGAIVTDSTFINNNASNSSGGGFDSTGSITTVTNSTFKNNSADSGGGFISDHNTTVTNSIFTNNSSKSDGGGFYSKSAATVINSTFKDNNATTGGGFASFYNELTVINSTFIDNSAAASGGGFASSSDYNTTVTNSIFISNSVDGSGGWGGGGFYSWSASTNIVNSLFALNSDGIYIVGENNKIYNTIFLDNTGLDIDGYGSDIKVSNLENNYIDLSKLTVQNVAQNNIFSDINLRFVNEASGDYNLTKNSDLIDAGTTNVAAGVTLPITDMNGNARIVGTNIDIGPYEFKSTEPAISSFSYSGTPKETMTLTFKTVYSLENGRTVSDVFYDYANDGSWTADNTHTFDKAGTYIVNVKVTDSAGESSIRSLSVTITEMTLQDELLSSLTQDEIDAILPIINKYKNAAVATASTSGIETGKTYVQNHLSEFSLVTETTCNATVATASTSGIETGKTYVQNHLSEFGLVTKSDIALTSAEVADLPEGWTLKSTPFAITDLSIFNTVSTVWVYDNATKKWSAYSPDATTQQKITNRTDINILSTIPAGSGIWIQK